MVNSMATRRVGDEEGNQNFRIASLPAIGGTLVEPPPSSLCGGARLAGNSARTVQRCAAAAIYFKRVLDDVAERLAGAAAPSGALVILKELVGVCLLACSRASG